MKKHKDTDGTLDAQTSNIYDLLGRHVESPGIKGSYIRKGKTILVH